MYLHVSLLLPIPVTTQVRHNFHEIFLSNIPEATLDVPVVNGIRFWFLFHHDEQSSRNHDHKTSIFFWQVLVVSY